MRMFGIPIYGESIFLNDNKRVVYSRPKLDFTLNKKHSSIAYHLVRWNIAESVVHIGWIGGMLNISYALTKILAAAKQ